MKKATQKKVQDFQAVKLPVADLKKVKGGGDIVIINDVMDI